MRFSDLVTILQNVEKELILLFEKDDYKVGKSTIKKK